MAEALSVMRSSPAIFSIFFFNFLNFAIKNKLKWNKLINAIFSTFFFNFLNFAIKNKLKWNKLINAVTDQKWP